MFSILTAYPMTDQYDRPFGPRQPDRKPASRLEIHRRHLEYEKMHTIDLMTLEHRSLERHQELIQRQKLKEARGERVTLFDHVRISLGATLIAIGERIRPEFAQGEPKLNA
jgi:hypothetical protein